MAMSGMHINTAVVVRRRNIRCSVVPPAPRARAACPRITDCRATSAMSVDSG